MSVASVDLPSSSATAHAFGDSSEIGVLVFESIQENFLVGVGESVAVVGVCTNVGAAESNSTGERIVSPSTS